MDIKVLIRKFILFVIGLFFIALGVSFAVKAGIGISPITSIPFVVSKIAPLTLGTCVFIFNVVLFILQIIILRKRFEKIQYMQLPLSIVFGFFTDFTKWMVMADKIPDAYIVKLIYTVLGCFIIAFGISCALIANVVLNPGDGIVKAVATVTEKKFGNVKVAIDVTLVVIASVISLIAFKNISGIREGTVIAAVTIGFIVKAYMKFLPQPITKIMKI